MFKKWIAEGLAALLAVSATTPLDGSELPASPGKVIVQEVQEKYEEGKYETFLQELQSEYEKAGKAGVLRGLFESAKATLKPEENEPSLEKYRAQIAQLSKVRNQRLLDAIAENPDLEIVQKVDTVVFFSLPEEQRQVLAELDSLKYHIPKSTEGTIENKISAIETEYYIKSLLLDVVKIHSNETSEEWSQKKIALQLQKLDKMLDAAREKGDENWIQKINLAKRGYLSEKSFRIDLEDLNALAIGKSQPQNTVEEKVKEIMMDYLNKQRASVEELVAQN